MRAYYSELLNKDKNLYPNNAFKVDGTNALAQIKEKNYAQKYMSSQKDIYLVGIEFDTKERNISKFEWERV